MLRRVLLLVVATVAHSACGGGSVTDADRTATSGEAIRREPGLNVLLITVDTLRADALGSYGNETASTPWMDRLASEGVRFANARAHNVVTLPAHASILTGLYPQEHGVRDNSGFRFPEDLPTLATILRQEGYRTAAFVSAFPLESRFGLDLGFDLYEDSFVGAERRPAFFEQERSGVETIALAREWMDADDDRPWFCWVHLYEPHFPYEPAEPFKTQFGEDSYLGDVATADAALAPLLEPLLNRTGDESSLVVLTSDHGEALGEHGEATHGIFAYEGTLRVPLVLHRPGLLEPRVVREPVRHIDILPTVLDILAIPVDQRLRGRSLLPEAMGGAAEGSPTTYFESLSPLLNRGWAPLYGIIDGDTKYIDLPIPELYDLARDPDEMTNIAATEPERLAELRGMLAPLRAVDPGSTPTPEDAETMERLRSLGYLTGSSGGKVTFTEADDPKMLMDLDVALRDVAGLYQEGNLSAALERARELVRDRPGMRMALLDLAHLERESGNLEAAVEALKEAYALHPTDSGTLALLGAYLTQAGRAQEAVDVTLPHSDLSEPDVDVLLVHALAQARSGRTQEALDAIEKAQRVAPENPMVLVHMGTLRLMSGARDQARGSFEEALEVNPDMVAAHTALGVMAIEEGRTEAGIEHWRRAVHADPQQLRRLLAMGMSLWNRGQISTAVPLLELFAESAPNEVYREEIFRVRSLLESRE